MRECWKPIEGYGGMYEVSNYGRVRSNDRTRLEMNAYGKMSPRTDKGRELALGDNGNGYKYVSIRQGGKRKNHYVHRLVAEAFCHKEPGATVINHKDRNRANNRADNLEWCTQRENVSYSAEHMRHPKRNCRKTNTGEKYISIISRHGNMRYRVYIKRLNVCRTFFTLKEAVSYRDEVMSGDV